MGHPRSNQAELSPVTSSEPANSCFPPFEVFLSMMVAAKSLQIYIPLPSAQPLPPLCRALTLSTQVPFPCLATLFPGGVHHMFPGLLAMRSMRGPLPHQPGRGAWPNSALDL